MVSLRRRRLLGLCSGRSSTVDPFSHIPDHRQPTPENCVENTKPVSEHPLPVDNGYPLKEETTLEISRVSLDFSASSASKESHHLRTFPGVKRRKRHRRKQVENQEPCTMRGVYYKNRKWQAAIKVDKKQIHLGTVGSEEEAARLYDRAAFMCGREPNFELSEEEKQELRRYSWDDFLAMTRSAITNKSRKSQRRIEPNWERKSQNNSGWETEGISASESSH